MVIGNGERFSEITRKCSVGGTLTSIAVRVMSTTISRVESTVVIIICVHLHSALILPAL